MTEKPVYTMRECVELSLMLVTSQIRENRINSIEELYGLKRHFEAALAETSPARIEALEADLRRVLDEHSRIIEINKAHCKTINSYLVLNSRQEDQNKALEAENARLKAERHIPRAPNAGRYLAEVNDGRLLYLNHADDWQECPNFIAAQEKALDEIIRKDRHTVYRTNQPGREVDGVFARIARCAREGGNNA